MVAKSSKANSVRQLVFSFLSGSIKVVLNSFCYSISKMLIALPGSLLALARIDLSIDDAGMILHEIITRIHESSKTKGHTEGSR